MRLLIGNVKFVSAFVSNRNANEFIHIVFGHFFFVSSVELHNSFFFLRFRLHNKSMCSRLIRSVGNNLDTMKYILVTGGVISGVGKGVIASSFGTLLNCCGIDVTSIKIDPYINIDAGTFSPYEHGKYVQCSAVRKFLELKLKFVISVYGRH